MLHKLRYVGAAGGEANLKYNSMAAFEWRIFGCGFDEKYEAAVRCNKVECQGIPFPGHWKTATRCADLGVLANQSSQSVGNGAAECILLGRPRLALMSNATATVRVPGAVVQLQTQTGSRQDYLLAAHLEGNRWFCSACGKPSMASMGSSSASQ